MPRPPASRLLARAGAVALLVVAALPVLWEPLFTDRILFFRDLGLWVRPVLERARLGGAAFPAWNPWLGTGRALAANPAFVLFHPVDLLYALFPFARAFDLAVASQVLLAGFSMLLLGRRLRLSWPGTLVAALGYMLGGWVVSSGGIYPLLGGTALAPLVLAVGLAASAEPSLRRLALLALLLGLQALGGAPEPVVCTALAGVVWSVLGTSTTSGAGRRTARTLGVWLAAGSWGALLAAVQLLPAARFAGSTLRGLGFTGQGALYWSVHPLRLLWLGVQGAGDDALSRLEAGHLLGNGTIDGGLPYLPSLYAGATVVLLAAVALLAPRHHPSLRRDLALTAAVGMVLALGRYLPGAVELVDASPVPFPFRYPEKALFLTFLSLPLLAGLGADSLALLVGPSRRRWLPPVLVLLVALDLGLAHRGMFPTVSREDVPAVEPLAAALQRSARDLGAPPNQWRLTHQRQRRLAWQLPGLAAGSDLDRYRRLHSLLFGATGLDAGLHYAFDPSIGLYDWQDLFRWTVVLYRASPEVLAKGMGEAGVLWLLSPRPDLEAASAGWLESGGELPSGSGVPVAGVWLYRVRAFLPRARLVTDFQVKPSANVEDGLERLRSDHWPPPVWLDRAPAGVTPDSAGAPGRATIVAESTAKLRVISDATLPAVLVVADVRAPGWEARVDGRRADILRANSVFRGVAVPQGRHQVVFRYRPPGLAVGAALSAVAALALLGAVAWGSRE